MAIDLKTNLGVDLDSIEMTDEHGTEWVRVEYSYECPTSLYLDGEETETINSVYIGPAKLYFYADNETGEFESVFRDWEIPSETDPENREWEGHTLIELDATEFPLEAEVLSDYHNAFMDDPTYEHEVGSKSIGSPEGYEDFEWPYPIHPDELYDDRKSVWNFKTGRVDLYRNHNIDIIRDAPTLDIIREERNLLLANSDSQYLMYQAADMTEQAEEMARYKQLLRDFPAAMEESGIPLIFWDSCWPKTTLIQLKSLSTIKE